MKLKVKTGDVAKRLLRDAARRHQLIQSPEMGTYIANGLARHGGSARVITASSNGARIAWERERMAVEQQRRVVEEAIDDAMRTWGDFEVPQGR